MKVRLILLFPPLTHPETELDLRGTWATLRRGGGKSEYGAGWTEAKVILNISPSLTSHNFLHILHLL